MTSQGCVDGGPRRRRAREGGGRGAGGGRGPARGRRTTLTRGAAASVAAYVANDVLDPDGLVRPLLRGAAERLRDSPVRLLCRVGAGYLRLDPHPVEVIEPGPEGVARTPPRGDVEAALPAGTGGAGRVDEVVDARTAADDAGPPSGRPS